MTDNDAGFRQFGRPETTTRAAIDTELLNCVLEAEQHIYHAKTYLYGGDIKSARDEIRRVAIANTKFYNTLIQRLLAEEGE